MLISRRASEIKPEPIRWLWPPRIALGKNSLIAGQPGLGKSQITTYLAAVTSSGGAWPCGELCDSGEVLILSAEDDAADTICPRLDACGANLDRVHIIEAVRDKRGSDRPFHLKHDLGRLSTELTASRGVKLVIIDPISAYLGDIDSHNNTAVRGVLAPLAKFAADHGTAVVCVTHLSKSLSADPLTRVIGSTAFGAAVRTAFLVAADSVDPDRRLFLPIKSNISRACPGLAFRIEPCGLPSGIETTRLAWDPTPVTMTASEALSPMTPDEIDDAKEQVEACLKIFDRENATELRSSRMIKLLKEQEDDFFINDKFLKKRLAICGIHPHKRSDANYYVKADFDTLTLHPSIPPSLHTSMPPSLQGGATSQNGPMDAVDAMDAMEAVEAVEAMEAMDPVEAMEAMKGMEAMERMEERKDGGCEDGLGQPQTNLK